MVKALFPFSGGLTGHGLRSSGNARYFLHQCLFYAKRLAFTITHLPKKLLSNKQHSLAKERAAAKKQNHPATSKDLTAEATPGTATSGHGEFYRVRRCLIAVSFRPFPPYLLPQIEAVYALIEAIRQTQLKYKNITCILLPPCVI